MGRGVPRRRVPRLRAPAAATSSTHGGVADMCILGEPTESKLVLGHFGSLWLRISTRGDVHPHRLQRRPRGRELDPAHARGARRRARVDPALGAAPPRTPARRRRRRQRRRARAAASPGASRAPRTAPTSSSTSASRRRSRWRGAPDEVLELVRGLRRALPRLRDRGRGVRHRARAPRSTPATRWSRALDAAPRARSSARRPSATVTRWYSDASALTALRHPDGQLRHLDRPPRHDRRREPRHRRARRDGATSMLSPRWSSAGWPR